MGSSISRYASTISTASILRGSVDRSASPGPCARSSSVRAARAGASLRSSAAGCLLRRRGRLGRRAAPSRMVNHPPPAPRSATIEPSAIRSSSMIKFGFCQSSRSGASSRPRSSAENSLVLGLAGAPWAQVTLRPWRAGGAGTGGAGTAEPELPARQHAASAMATTRWCIPGDYTDTQCFLPSSTARCSSSSGPRPISRPTCGRR